MKMIRADGARRLYSSTYLASARAGAFIQNASTMVVGAVPLCAVVSGSEMYIEGASLVKLDRASSGLEVEAIVDM